MDNLEGVSIVTTTYNEKDMIAELLLAVRELLKSIPHEIIVVDDSSPDGTAEIAKRFADTVVVKRREGQTKGLADGMMLARYPRIVTLDADMENDPKLIPTLLDHAEDCDVLIACRTVIPRWSERLFSLIFSKKIGVKDVLSNYRVYRRSIVKSIYPIGRETFGAELLINAFKRGYRIKEIIYPHTPRRLRPRIGNTVTANLRILDALLRSTLMWLRRHR